VGQHVCPWPIEDVVAELSTFADRKALFIDLSPVEDIHYAKALYRAMIPLRMRWVGLATTRIAEDDELLSSRRNPAGRGFVDRVRVDQPDDAQRNHKGFHASRDYAEVVKKLHDYGIAFRAASSSVSTMTMRVFFRAHGGMGGQGGRWICRAYAVVTPFPKRVCFGRLRGRGPAVAQELVALRCEHVVLQPKKMSPERLQEGLEWAWAQSYSYRSIFRRVLWSFCSAVAVDFAQPRYRYFSCDERSSAVTAVSSQVQECR